MSQIDIPAEQQQAFDERCHKDGLDPRGFDLRAYSADGTPSNVEMVVVISDREHRYPIAQAGDFAWIDQFFVDIKKIGDPGDNC